MTLWNRVTIEWCDKRKPPVFARLQDTEDGTLLDLGDGPIPLAQVQGWDLLRVSTRRRA